MNRVERRHPGYGHRRRTAAVLATVLLAGLSGCTGSDQAQPAEGPLSSDPTRHPLAAPSSPLGGPAGGTGAAPARPAGPVARPLPGGHPVQLSGGVAAQLPGQVSAGIPGRLLGVHPPAAGQAPVGQHVTAPLPFPDSRQAGQPSTQLPGTAGAKPAVTVTVTVTAPASPAPTRTAAVQRRQRPGWIQEFFKGHGFMGGCDDERPGSTATMLVLQRLERGAVCFRGYARNPAPVFRLTAPSGTVTTVPGRYFDGSWTWDLQPGAAGSPLTEEGAYRFGIEGRVRTGAARPDPGPVRSSGEIMVVPARQPGVALSFVPPAQNERIRRGTTVVFQVAGHRPGARVFVTIYGERGRLPGYQVFEDLPDLVTDRDGTGEIRWTVPASARPGRYAFWVDPAPLGADPGDGLISDVEVTN